MWNMARLQRIGAFNFVVMATIFCAGLQAQVGDPGTLTTEKLASQIKLTKAAADHSDIVTAGDVVVLHKDGLVMCSSASTYSDSNTYSGGVLKADYKNRSKDAAKQGGMSILKSHIPFGGGGGSVTDAVNNGCTERKFVAGEKFWITAITLQKDGVLVSTFSDPYNDVRYYGSIKFLFAKGTAPAPDDFVKTVQEVITVDPGDAKDGGDSKQAKEAPPASGPAQGPAPAQAPAPAPAAPLEAIAPPPPPADAPPPTISMGQTKDQVTAAFGQPIRTAKVGTKEIYFYKDMKVTFTAGKVSNVE
jgi:hypothetical protein